MNKRDFKRGFSVPMYLHHRLFCNKSLNADFQALDTRSQESTINSAYSAVGLAHIDAYLTDGRYISCSDDDYLKY